MKTAILLLAFPVLLVSSCTTAYKTGQTPDDVYYSPAKPQDETVKEEKDEDRYYSYDDNYYDDRYLRMKVRNRYRWSDLDNWYNYDRYSIGYNYSFGSFNNPYNTWSYYYNPYCCCLNNYNYVFVNPKAPVSPPVVRKHFSLAGYNNSGYNNSNNNNNGGMIKSPGRSTTTAPVYNNSNNNNRGLSDKVRTIFSNDDNSGRGSSRTYNPSSSSSSGSNNNSSSSSSSGSSGNSGGGSSGGVSRPTRN